MKGHFELVKRKNQLMKLSKNKLNPEVHYPFKKSLFCQKVQQIHQLESMRDAYKNLRKNTFRKDLWFLCI